MVTTMEKEMSMEQKDAIIENKVRDYFEAFGNKDEQSLVKLTNSLNS